MLCSRCGNALGSSKASIEESAHAKSHSAKDMEKDDEEDAQEVECAESLKSRKLLWYAMILSKMLLKASTLDSNALISDIHKNPRGVEYPPKLASLSLCSLSIISLGKYFSS